MLSSDIKSPSALVPKSMVVSLFSLYVFLTAERRIANYLGDDLAAIIYAAGMISSARYRARKPSATRHDARIADTIFRRLRAVSNIRGKSRMGIEYIAAVEAPMQQGFSRMLTYAAFISRVSPPPQHFARSFRSTRSSAPISPRR